MSSAEEAFLLLQSLVEGQGDSDDEAIQEDLRRVWPGRALEGPEPR